MKTSHREGSLLYCFICPSHVRQLRQISWEVSTLFHHLPPQSLFRLPTFHYMTMVPHGVWLKCIILLVTLQLSRVTRRHVMECYDDTCWPVRSTWWATGSFLTVCSSRDDQPLHSWWGWCSNSQSTQSFLSYWWCRWFFFWLWKSQSMRFCPLEINDRFLNLNTRFWFMVNEKKCLESLSNHEDLLVFLQSVTQLSFYIGSCVKYISC